MRHIYVHSVDYNILLLEMAQNLDFSLGMISDRAITLSLILTKRNILFQEIR